MPNTSVIVPTYNGRHKIISTLRALESQQFKDFETIVVIDGSTDGTNEFLHELTFTLNLKIYQQKNEGRARVRNTGAELASGELLIFYDDDMIPEPDSVLRHFNFHNQYKLTLCGGNQLENVAEAVTDFDLFRCYLRNRWLSKYHHVVNEINKSNLFLTAANFSIHKKLFFQIGGFNIALNDAEDLELANRAIKQGYKIFFDKNNICWHDDFISCRQYINRRRQYLLGYERLKTIEQSLIEERLIKLNIAKRLLFSFFSHRIWVLMIDNQYFKFLPRQFRFKLYDLVVTGLGSVFVKRMIE
jgi:glycosyltransferase involved in cell wall biosynthesis